VKKIIGGENKKENIVDDCEKKNFSCIVDENSQGTKQNAPTLPPVPIIPAVPRVSPARLRSSSIQQPKLLTKTYIL
jgi:hypothetical protein